MTVPELESAIRRLWVLYRRPAASPTQVEAAYEAWARLVAQLHAQTHDRTTGRVTR